MTSGASGLKSHQVKMDTIGNNLANVNTTGFKSGKTQFQTLLFETMAYGSGPAGGFPGGVNPQQIGLGASVATITTDHMQGTLQPTGVATDLAVDGAGFFVMEGPDSQAFYTRDGTFRLNQGNLLVQPSTGYILQGYQADSDFNINTGGALSDINLPLGQLTVAKATENADFVGNLNAAGDRGITGTVAGADRLFNTVAGNPVTSATALTSLALTDGGVAIFSANDVISIDADKGGRSLDTARFIVGESAPLGGTTLGDLVSFIEDAYGINTNGYSALRSGGGDTATGVTSAGTSNTQLMDATKDFTTLGIQVGDTVTFTSGNAQGLTATVAAIPNATTVTFSTTFADTEAPAAGDIYEIHRPAGVSFNNTTDIIELHGNLGVESNLTNLQIVNTTTSVNPFSFTTTASADGESVQTSMLAYDSLGIGHRVNVTFVLMGVRSMGSTLNAANTWEWMADAADDSDVDLSVGRGTIRFNGEGQFFSEDGGAVTLNLTGTGAATPQNMDLDFATMTQFGADYSEANLSEQDGYAEGTLNTVSVGDDGIVTGIFTNGLSRSIAQIPVARFTNPDGLIALGANLYRSGANSGTAQTGVAGQASRGVIRGGTLEQSNVDLAEQFTELITTQRGFEANARIISTANQMLQELTNLVR